MARHDRRTLRDAVLAALLLATLGGCGGGMAELRHKLDEMKQRPGSRIEPLREVTPYESYVYNSTGIRSPFVPSVPVTAPGQGGLRPDDHRRREFLEGFSLDTLKMVGTLRQGGRAYGLLQTKDGLVHKVVPGNYVGQNDGKITAVTESKITVVEIVPDGMGGYLERPASIPLATN